MLQGVNKGKKGVQGVQSGQRGARKKKKGKVTMEKKSSWTEEVTFRKPYKQLYPSFAHLKE